MGCSLAPRARLFRRTRTVSVPDPDELKYEVFIFQLTRNSLTVGDLPL